jgi:hypothetical protein
MELTSSCSTIKPEIFLLKEDNWQRSGRQVVHDQGFRVFHSFSSFSKGLSAILSRECDYQGFRRTCKRGIEPAKHVRVQARS